MPDDLQGRPANMAARQVLPIEDPPVAGDEPPAPAGSAGTSTASDQTPQALQVLEDPHGPMRTRSGRAIGTDVQAPPTTPVHDAYAFKVKTIDAEEDQLLRRIHPDQPFYPEPGVGRMEGAGSASNDYPVHGRQRGTCALPGRHGCDYGVHAGVSGT